MVWHDDGEPPRKEVVKLQSRRASLFPSILLNHLHVLRGTHLNAFIVPNVDTLLFSVRRGLRTMYLIRWNVLETFIYLSVVARYMLQLRLGLPVDFEATSNLGFKAIMAIWKRASSRPRSRYRSGSLAGRISKVADTAFTQALGGSQVPFPITCSWLPSLAARGSSCDSSKRLHTVQYD